MPARCRDEESMSDLCTIFLTCVSGHHEACKTPAHTSLTNSGPFGHRSEVDDASDVEKTDQYFFDL
jgi:hypothetical protein